MSQAYTNARGGSNPPLRIAWFSAEVLELVDGSP